jgi:tetratricopeptide (TPR) repeat protein
MSQEELSLQLEWWRDRLRAGAGPPAKVHAKIGRALCKLGRTAEAIPHLRQAVESEPGDHMAWLRLAVGLDRHGSPAERLWAWSAALEGEPENWGARERVIAALEAMGRLPEAIEHAQTLADAEPQNLKHCTRLARLLTAADRIEPAIEAWKRAAALSPVALEATDRIGQLTARLRHRASPAGSPPLRLAVIGNCQAYGIGLCLRALAPEVEVMSIQWADIRDAEDAERFVAGLSDYDAVISHPTKSVAMPALATADLGRRVKALHLVPSIHFTGFHPDVVWLPGPPWKGQAWPFGAYHSGLVMACFTMGLPPDRTLELFNAYVFAALGYFDEYAKAVEHHARAGQALGFDVGGLMAADGLSRPFMHVPNHPTIPFVFALCRQLCARLGISAQAGEPPPDPFADHAVWPVYPEIAKRIGCEGSLVFRARRSRTAREPADRMLALDEVVAQSYRLLAAMPPEALDLPRVTDARAVLERLGV